MVEQLIRESNVGVARLPALVGGAPVAIQMCKASQPPAAAHDQPLVQGSQSMIDRLCKQEAHVRRPTAST
ncbi:hypothetical protein GW17_00060798 [Ensete ventricosum]|nr:hypothetical protein GW17_00060798 [Ensete ventricosum]